MGGGVISAMERYLGDLDTFCAYRTSRTLMIRDKRLGLSLFSLQAVIFLYVVIWQLILSQVYMKESDFATVVRLQLQAPTLPYRWPPAIAPPYCLGATALPPPSVYPLASAYAIPSPGEFTYNGLSQEQRHCQYMDETGAVPIPETDRMFITSETRQTNQSVVGGDPATCSTLSSLDCTFMPAYNREEDAVTRRSFVADVEFFTLLIDHSLAAPSAGISRTVSSMEGSLLDQSGKVMNPCDDYAGMPKGCPTNATAGFDVALGKAGLPDIVSLKTLLRAAGITSMDQLAGLQGRDAGESLREAGLVLNLEIYYTNYFFSGKGAFQLGNGAIDNSRVVYQYRVTTVANTEYKFITGVYPFGDQTTRELMNRHGIRLLVTTTGRIGFFDLMTLLINLNVAAGLIGLSYIFMDVVVTQCCPLSAIYRQFKERRTVDISDLRHAMQGRSIKSFVRKFEEDDIVDPIPEVIREMLELRAGAGKGRGKDGEEEEGMEEVEEEEGGGLTQALIR